MPLGEIPRRTITAIAAITMTIGPSRRCRLNMAKSFRVWYRPRLIVAGFGARPDSESTVNDGAISRKGYDIASDAALHRVRRRDYVTTTVVVPEGE
jgi:hypothetical protein